MFFCLFVLPDHSASEKARLSPWEPNQQTWSYGLKALCNTASWPQCPLQGPPAGPLLDSSLGIWKNSGASSVTQLITLKGPGPGKEGTTASVQTALCQTADQFTGITGCWNYL